MLSKVTSTALSILRKAAKTSSIEMRNNAIFNGAKNVVTNPLNSKNGIYEEVHRGLRTRSSVKYSVETGAKLEEVSYRGETLIKKILYNADGTVLYSENYNPRTQVREIKNKLNGEPFTKISKKGVVVYEDGVISLDFGDQPIYWLANLTGKHRMARVKTYYYEESGKLLKKEHYSKYTTPYGEQREYLNMIETPDGATVLNEYGDVTREITIHRNADTVEGIAYNGNHRKIGYYKYYYDGNILKTNETWHTDSYGNVETYGEYRNRVNAKKSVSQTPKPSVSQNPNNTASKPSVNQTQNSSSIQQLTNKTNNGITFADIGGQQAAIDKLKKTVLYPIKCPVAFEGRKISHGIVLYGPPGTGKSLLAEALANETNAHFIKLNGLEMETKWIGDTEQKWRELFAEAKQKQPCIIFIDEIDAIAGARGRNAGSDHSDKVVNQLLTLISDIEKENQQVYVISATNRLDMLDKALIRAGRLETHIQVEAPQTIKDILQVFDIHSKTINLSEDLDKERISEILLEHNATGADIASIMNDAFETSYSKVKYAVNDTAVETTPMSIYEKIEKGLFKKEDLADCKLTNEDFEQALKKKYGDDITLSQRKVYEFNNLDDVIVD